MQAPSLKHRDEFEKILNDYHFSDATQKILGSIKLVILASPTSAGRNSIIDLLKKTDQYEYLISDTTRPKRVNNGKLEEDGVHYHFKSEEEFLKGLKKGEYLEAAIIHSQQVSGISVRELNNAQSHDKIAITETEIAGADVINIAKPDADILFVLPPSYYEWMNRLRKRGSMSQDEFLNRLRSAEKELEHALDKDFYKFVINDELEDAVITIRDLVEKDIYSQELHEKSKRLAWQLLNEVKASLSS